VSGKPIVIAHRGGAAEAPENSMEAFERAIRLGYPGVEFDVRMSKDGVPVVVHDEAVREGRVADLPAAKIASIPTLDAVLALAWGAMTLMVEVKPTATDAGLGGCVARRLGPRAILASFSHAVLRAAAMAAPELRLMALLDADTDEASFAGIAFDAYGVDRALLDAANVARWKAAGRQLWTWTIKDLDQMRRAVALGVDGLITDVPGKVRAALGRGPA
jgi:glycerophosphoryl diester phosphodiesterase